MDAGPCLRALLFQFCKDLVNLLCTRVEAVFLFGFYDFFLQSLPMVVSGNLAIEFGVASLDVGWIADFCSGEEFLKGSIYATYFSGEKFKLLLGELKSAER